MFGKLPSYALKAMRYLLTSPGVAGRRSILAFRNLAKSSAS